MGQRASVIKFNFQGEAIVTTLQWSTYLDMNIAAELRAHPEGDASSVAAQVINNIVETSGHLSSIDGETMDDDTNAAATVIGKFLRGYGPQDEGNHNIGAVSYVEAADYHLNGDSVGVIIDLRKPGVLTFFWEDYEEGLRFHKVTPAELRAAGGVPVTFERW